MSVDTDDGRRSKSGYALQQVRGVDVYVAERLSQYAVWALVDMKRGLLGRRFVIDFEHVPEEACPE